MASRRVAFAIGVVYETPYEKVAAIPGMIQEVVESQGDQVEFSRAHFKSYGDFSLNFETVYYVLMADYTAYMDIQQSINLRIYEAFEQEGIVFAFPTQTVHLIQQNPVT
jgi:small-conductance mechanosensitive channel